MNILVTGASGFVGRHLCRELARRGHRVTAACRSVTTPEIDGAVQKIIVGDIGSETDWSQALEGQDAIIHLAARAHVMKETTTDPETLYHEVNVAGTRGLVEQAQKMGVGRLVFLSSIKVNGEQTSGQRYTEAMAPAPEDAYGRTKQLAEQVVAMAPGLKTTVVRCPLVYGPGVKGNFLKLINACDRQWPLPVTAINNSRSLIFVGNLVDALAHCLERDGAIDQTFLVSDGADFSTPQLVRSLSQALGKPYRGLYFPVCLLKLAGRLTGKSAAILRLSGSLQVDSRLIREKIGWLPPFTPQQGLEKTAIWYQNLAHKEGAPNP